MTDEHDLPHLITVAQAAEILGVHHQTIRNMIARGEIPAYTLKTRGRAIRIDANDVLHALRRIPTTSGSTR